MSGIKKAKQPKKVKQPKPAIKQKVSKNTKRMTRAAKKLAKLRRKRIDMAISVTAVVLSLASAMLDFMIARKRKK